MDFVRYAERKGIKYSAISAYAISLDQIKEMVEEQRVTLRQGDVLIIRTGLSKWIRESTPESKGLWEGHQHTGVEPTEALVEWIWDQNFAAVASDAIAFEVISAEDKSSTTPEPPLFCHRVLTRILSC